MSSSSPTSPVQEKPKLLGKKFVVTVGKGPPSPKIKTLQIPTPVEKASEQDNIFPKLKTAFPAAEALKLEKVSLKSAESTSQPTVKAKPSPPIVGVKAAKTEVPPLDKHPFDSPKLALHKKEMLVKNNGEEKTANIFAKKSPTLTAKVMTPILKGTQSPLKLLPKTISPDSKIKSVSPAISPVVTHQTLQKEAAAIPEAATRSVYSELSKAMIVLPTGYGSAETRLPTDMYISFHGNDIKGIPQQGDGQSTYYTRMRGSPAFMESLSGRATAISPTDKTPQSLNARKREERQNNEPGIPFHNYHGFYPVIAGYGVVPSNLQMQYFYPPLLPMSFPFMNNRDLRGMDGSPSSVPLGSAITSSNGMQHEAGLPRMGTGQEYVNRETSSGWDANDGDTSLIEPLKLPPSLPENRKSLLDARPVGFSPWEKIENQFNLIRAAPVVADNAEALPQKVERAETITDDPYAYAAYNSRYQNERMNWQEEDPRISSRSQTTTHLPQKSKYATKKAQKGWDRWGHKAGVSAPRKRVYQNLTEMANYFSDLEPDDQSDVISLLLSCRKLEKQIEEQRIVIDMLENDLSEAQQTLKFPPEWRCLQDLDLSGNELSDAVIPQNAAPLFLKGRVDLIPPERLLKEATVAEDTNISNMKYAAKSIFDSDSIALKSKNLNKSPAPLDKTKQEGKHFAPKPANISGGKKTLSPISKAKMMFGKKIQS
ncbi:hypothetical protein IE077_001648 [Cardiosporidium cionae]|uniref:Uncharacterized protein n=1 Tax=Cardiosporidium cionae TaxID=476202 RepID=A0ABQ7J567_9APIC|nr:hypothetical protein IE077_001648 [Cardiosporidium cionae]|eukprot:KAF8819111.1 hypothetical protein IE077_001648 [Cardiosporidium cionae]